MACPPSPKPVTVGATPGGGFTYLVDLPPEALPAVRGRDLERAWEAARDAARAGRWGVVRGFRFRRQDGSFADLALADPDAGCWASAVDATVGLDNCYGLSVCLRLLALVDLLARTPWTARLFRLERDGAALHPSLLRAAADAPLTCDGRFDESWFRTRLPSSVLSPSGGSARLTGATA